MFYTTPALLIYTFIRMFGAMWPILHWCTVKPIKTQEQLKPGSLWTVRASSTSNPYLNINSNDTYVKTNIPKMLKHSYGLTIFLLWSLVCPLLHLSKKLNQGPKLSHFTIPLCQNMYNLWNNIQSNQSHLTKCRKTLTDDRKHTSYFYKSDTKIIYSDTDCIVLIYSSSDGSHVKKRSCAVILYEAAN